MHSYNTKIIFFVVAICFILNIEALPPNRTHHVRRSSVDDSFFNKNQKLPSYRSFQPVSIKYHKATYPKQEERPDYDITSYDTEYGGVVVSNFTSSIYDDNPQLYPNPELVSKNNQAGNKILDSKPQDSEVELPDDSLADADLKEHNIIDSVTYLYGYNNDCNNIKNEWTVLITITGIIAASLLVLTMAWLMMGSYAAEFRRHSKLFPININLCCSLCMCTLIYTQAISGSSSQAQCERIALLLHYSHISSAMWIVALAAAVTEYCACDTILPLKYIYLLSYGVPAIVVMFNYALSMEQYETKHYCWMSIEKGMVMGFMVPAMILILINTGIVIIGLQCVNRKQAEMLTAKIQELVDHHIANWPKNVPMEDNKNASLDTLDIYTPGSSRKNTDSSDTLEKEFNDEDYGNIGTSNVDVNGEGNEATPAKTIQDKGLLNMLYMDNLSWKWSWNTEGNELKSYLNLCLVMEPFFAINWVMGVVAIENATHWSTPTIYLVLVLSMAQVVSISLRYAARRFRFIYLTATLCTTLPIVRNKTTTPCCEEVVAEPTLTRARTTDSIPLLDPAVQQPNVTPAPADTISTISI